jgi:magnesium/cobalt transport protein CorA
MTGRNHKIRVLTAAGLEEPTIEELPAILEGLKKPEGPVTWIHAEPGSAVIRALDDMGLDEVAVKSLRGGPERPRVEEFADHIYISLFSADHPVGPKRNTAAVLSTPFSVRDSEDEPACATEGCLPTLNELRIFLGPRWIISIGHLHTADYKELMERIQRQVFSRGRGASFITYHVCEWLVESLQPVLDQLDDRVDSLEDEVVLASGAESVQTLFGLKRDLVDLRRRIAPLRDVMQRLGSHGVSHVEPDAEVYFRDVHDDVMRVIELLDTYRDIMSSALDLHLSSVSNRLNRVMKQLTVVATVFMPLSFIVGLFGTNFTRMPFGSLAWFLVMFVLMFISTSVMALLLYTWRKL